MTTNSSYYIIFLTAILVFIYVYPKLQLMFNRELLYISPGSWSTDDKYIPKRIVIVGLIRDAGNRIDTLRHNVEMVGDLFDDYRVLVVENDSVDTTRQGLLHWVESNPKVTVLGCGYDVKECHIPSEASKTIKHSFDRARIEKMVRLRNIYWRE